MPDTPQVLIFAVRTENGTVLDQLACQRDQLAALLESEYPTRRHELDEDTLTITLHPVGPTMTQEEIDALKATKVSIQGTDYSLIYIGGQSRRRTRKTIQIEAAPTSRWAPGEPIPDQVLQRWLGEPGSIISADAGFMVRPAKEIVYVFGPWRPELAEQINTLLAAEAAGGLNPHAYGFKQFTDAVVGIKERERQRMAARCSELQEEIDDVTRRMTDMMRELRAVRRLMTVAPESVDVTAILNQVAQVNGVSKLWVDGQKVCFQTDSIEILNRDVRYDIGVYNVSIDIVSGAILFHNQTRTVDGYHHPHVFSNGNACLGEIASVVPQLVSDFMLVELVNVLLHYLRSVNDQDSAGRNIVNWPIIQPQTAAQAAK